jgi:ABC-type proline/glycine betaine transport system permease subunit
MYSSFIRQHLLISLVSWLLGMIIGGSLGYAWAIAARRIFTVSPALKKPLTLFPWRTIAVALPLSSSFIPLWTGLGTSAGIMVGGLILSVFAASITATRLIEHWYPQPLLLRLIAGVRTLATASPLVATAAELVGGGGAAYLILEGINLLNPNQYFTGIWIVVLLALALDMLIGVVQMYLTKIPRSN